jgi:invasion protein IalB
MKKPVYIASCAIFLTFCASNVAQAQDTQPQAAGVVSTLPGGASSLNERHGDWTVACGMAEGGKQCFFSQVLGNSDTGQRTLSIELKTIGDNRLEGMLLTPFSLRFDAGVKLAVDERRLAGPVPFLSCIPAGCLVPVAFEGDVFAALQAGTTLSFSATPLGSDEEITLPISLNGFTAASRRTSELNR